MSTSSTKSRTTSSQRNWVYESVGFSLCRTCQHMSAYVSIRTFSTRQHTSAYVSLGTGCMKASVFRCVAYLSKRQHSSAYRQHTSAYASIRQPRNWVYERKRRLLAVSPLPHYVKVHLEYLKEADHRGLRLKPDLKHTLEYRRGLRLKKFSKRVQPQAPLMGLF